MLRGNNFYKQGFKTHKKTKNSSSELLFVLKRLLKMEKASGQQHSSNLKLKPIFIVIFLANLLPFWKKF